MSHGLKPSLFVKMANQDLEVNIEVVKNIFRSEKTSIQGKFSHYEETYDGTASGWYKFRKDLASAVGNDEIQVLYRLLHNILRMMIM